MDTKEQMHSLSSSRDSFEDLTSVGEALTDDELLMAVGGLMLIDIEVVSYIDGKVIDHQIDIFYI